MGPPCGFLWRLDASKPLHFRDRLFFATAFSLFFQVDLVFSFRLYEKVLPGHVGSTILVMGTHHFGARTSPFRPLHAHDRMHVGAVFGFLPLHTRKA